jgi:hypothetical protein
MNNTFVASSWIKIIWLLSGKKPGLPTPHIDDETWETLEKFLFSYTLVDAPAFTVAWYKYKDISRKDLSLSKGLSAHLNALGFDSPKTDLWCLIQAYQKYLNPVAIEIQKMFPDTYQMRKYLESSNKIVFDLFGMEDEDIAYWNRLNDYGKLLKETNVLIVPDKGMQPLIDNVPIALTLGYLSHYDQILEARQKLKDMTVRYGEVLLPPLVTIYLDYLDKITTPAQALLKMRNDFKKYKRKLTKLHTKYYATKKPSDRSLLENKLIAERMEIIKAFNIKDEDAVKAREVEMIEYAESRVSKFGLIKLGRDALTKIGISRYLSPYHSIVSKSNKYYKENEAKERLGWY